MGEIRFVGTGETRPATRPEVFRQAEPTAGFTAFAFTGFSDSAR